MELFEISLRPEIRAMLVEDIALTVALVTITLGWFAWMIRGTN